MDPGLTQEQAEKLVGTFAGIVATSKLTEYRIKELERKVEKHNSIVERTFRLEDKFELVDEKIKVANHRIDDLERERSLK